MDIKKFLNLVAMTGPIICVTVFITVIGDTSSVFADNIRNADRVISAGEKKIRRSRGGVHTTALWLFDEPLGLYPSSALDDASENDLVMSLGMGAQITGGKFGNGLSLTDQPKLKIPKGIENYVSYGFVQMKPGPGRRTPPLTWFNDRFVALMTSGERHLRKEIGFTNPTDTDLNLGGYDWTVEFWYALPSSVNVKSAGVIFEIGTGPRGENNKVTRLELAKDQSRFILENQPSGIALSIPTSVKGDGWHHYAFVYDAKKARLSHYVDGKLQIRPARAEFRELARGAEAYFTLGRDGLWNNPLRGRLDEVRFSLGQVYLHDFTPPSSFAPKLTPMTYAKGPALLFNAKNPALLFNAKNKEAPLALGSRKHLFIDDAILAKKGGARFAVNPPKRLEAVIDNIKGPFRKHLSVVEGDDGLIRIYNSVEKDYLAVYVSKDGVNFYGPDVGHGIIEGHRNIVIAENVGGLGNPFFDPQAPPDERWKYFSDSRRRGIYLYTSPDGFTWKRWHTAILPFRSGTQTSTFYDDQRQLYVAYHRSGIFHTPAGDTRRSSVLTEHKDLRVPLPFNPLTQQDYRDLRKDFPLREPLPWFADNGPLTPGGFGMEYPHKFDPLPMDPVGTDFYVTKAMKYPWAADTYLAFPIAYFHYENDGPLTRRILGDKDRGRGSGPLETQLSVSRNGTDWTRYPRPAYVGIGRQAGRNTLTAYIANGMVRRGEEIWQYYFAETQYHSAYRKDMGGRAVYRLVQRLDGFVSLDSPYEKEITVVTKPLVFKGDRLQLNIDTDAMGYAQIGFLDAKGQPIEGFSVDDCIYINGDFIKGEVEWLGKGLDVSSLAGRTVQLVLRMRGSKLYAMQFVDSKISHRKNKQ